MKARVTSTKTRNFVVGGGGRGEGMERGSGKPLSVRGGGGGGGEGGGEVGREEGWRQGGERATSDSYHDGRRLRGGGKKKNTCRQSNEKPAKREGDLWVATYKCYVPKKERGPYGRTEFSKRKKKKENKREQ